MKAEINKIDVDKQNCSCYLGKLSSVVNNEVVKKIAYDKLVAKENNIDTSGFVLKTKYYTDKPDLQKKFSDADKKNLMLVDLLKKQIIMQKLLK